MHVGDTDGVRVQLINHDDGIDVGGRGDTIVGNRVDRSVHDGIDVDGSDVLVASNNSTRNGDDGIGVGREASNVTIRNNVANDNVDLGIQPIAGTAIDGAVTGRQATSTHASACRWSARPDSCPWIISGVNNSRRRPIGGVPTLPRHRASIESSLGGRAALGGDVP